jgi:N-acetyl-anhydromuramyl-L-alanine amidase AmpD
MGKYMKTAMQELSEWLQAYEYELPLELQIKAKEALEKEKEQIIDAFEVGYKSCDIDEAFEINRKLASGELYYNKTYNQNK